MSRTVKSAVRVLEVLEYFDRLQREATVTEISRELNYPQSSTSILLQNLIQRGYLQRGIKGKTFLPTTRVTVLGSWLAPVQVPRGDVLSLMQDLGEATGETIILAALAGEVVRYIHVVPATKAMRLHVGAGLIRPLAASSAGLLFVSRMSEDQIRKVIARYNSAETDDSRRLSMAGMRREFAAIRLAGYAMSLDGITPGAGGIAMLLPDTGEGAPRAIIIGGLSRTIRENCEAYAQLVRKGIRRLLKPAARAAANGRTARK